MRDEFSVRIKKLLAKRVNYHCSNPRCRRPTTGPHKNPERVVNVGVAAHIAAAAQGGPRFDTSMSPNVRASAENGIWLCQKCAKLVDSDVERHSSIVLTEWKSGAESLATWELECQSTAYKVAQAHAPLPSIYGIRYDSAREQLLSAGWQPYMRHWNESLSSDLQYGNGAIFWARGYHELVSACPTGYAFCRFEFKDVYGNKLCVITAGEEDADDAYHASVVRWFFESDFPA
jgi:hypothetical protein